MFKSNANKIVLVLMFGLVACSQAHETVRSQPLSSTNATSESSGSTALSSSENNAQPVTKISPPTPKQESVEPKSFDETDVLKGKALFRSLTKNQSSMILFENPTGESAASMVFCQHSLKAARALLDQPQMGGIVIIKGSTLVFKNDKSQKFNDGSALRGDYVQMKCL